MTRDNKLYLDTHRHHLTTAKQGFAKGLDEHQMYLIMASEFSPGYGYPNSAGDMLQLIEDIYEAYDEWEEQPGEDGLPRFNVESPELKFPEPEPRSRHPFGVW